MSIRLQFLLVILSLIVLEELFRRIQKRRLLLQYSLSWLSLLVALIVVAVFPSLLTTWSNILGIVSPINMVFFLGFCFSLLIIFGLTMAVSKMSEQIKELTQKIALMEKKYESEYEKNK